tara:strand:- start:504 stop:707 length:204 start_codon:yes stop_codon:yes gene_type:complete
MIDNQQKLKAATRFIALNPTLTDGMNESRVIQAYGETLEFQGIALKQSLNDLWVVLDLPLFGGNIKQ